MLRKESKKIVFDKENGSERLPFQMNAHKMTELHRAVEDEICKKLYCSEMFCTEPHVWNK